MSPSTGPNSATMSVFQQSRTSIRDGSPSGEVTASPARSGTCLSHVGELGISSVGQIGTESHLEIDDRHTGIARSSEHGLDPRHNRPDTGSGRSYGCSPVCPRSGGSGSPRRSSASPCSASRPCDRSSTRTFCARRSPTRDHRCRHRAAADPRGGRCHAARVAAG